MQDRSHLRPFYFLAAFMSAVAIIMEMAYRPGLSEQDLRKMVFQHHVPDPSWFGLEKFQLLGLEKEREEAQNEKGLVARVRYRLKAKRAAMKILEEKLKEEGLSIDGDDEKSRLRRKEIGGGIAGAFGNFKKGDLLEITEEVHLVPDGQGWRIYYTYRKPDGLVYLLPDVKSAPVASTQ